MHKSRLLFVLYVLAVVGTGALLLTYYWSVAHDLRLLNLFSA